MTLTRYRRGAGRLPFRWQTVFSREVGGRSGAELLQRTFFLPRDWPLLCIGIFCAPGHWSAWNWWKGGEGHASKERDGERVKSKTGQQVSHWYPFPGFGLISLLPQKNADKDDFRDFFKVRFFYDSLAGFSVGWLLALGPSLPLAAHFANNRLYPLSFYPHPANARVLRTNT